ncbi:AAA family ATPase [Microbacterium sp. CIAB417]|uniref:AAA family ATPase n=1 Tax=Microbacterium sp. CIAB417 TaxID=2860287 RepID=UPI001FAE05FB|nr:ATP-binding protein [Microbacterium sp. CIAB417]
MAGRQIKDVVRAFQARDELAFRRAVNEIIEEEEARHHFAIARDLRALLAVGGGARQPDSLFTLPPAPKSRDNEWDLIDVRIPELDLSDLVLEPSVASTLDEVAGEVAHWEELTSAGVPKRQKLLFTGPAGTGKTSAAEGLATMLGWPLGLVSVDTVVSSYLGETATNLRRVFEFARDHRLVLVFDEFDALGRMRDDSSEHGEMKRVVSSFLQFLDHYSGPSILIAITNYPGLLDFALWRRFDEVAEFKRPSVHAIRRLLRLRARAMRVKPFATDEVASALRGLPHAAVERFVYDVRREQILRGEVSSGRVSELLRGIRQRAW